MAPWLLRSAQLLPSSHHLLCSDVVLRSGHLLCPRRLRSRLLCPGCSVLLRSVRRGRQLLCSVGLHELRSRRWPGPDGTGCPGSGTPRSAG